MDTFAAIEARRAVKHYDSEHKLTEEELNKLLEAVVKSPTSFNIQNWRFVRVVDGDLREQIKAAAWGQAQVTDASELFILCANLNAWADRPERYWRNAPEAVQQQLVPMIGQFYEGNEQLQRDEAMRSCGIAAQTLMLSAKALGYDSCPMIGFDAAQVAELIKLPADHVIGMFVVVGKATQPARERGGQLPVSEVVIQNQFG